MSAPLPAERPVPPPAASPAAALPPAPPSRAARLRALEAEPFDLLVIGGGATGAGAAYDAALRGLRVALVEREDFASGTSSRSSRLIHGGLRYLEHGHLGLVFEASVERRRLLRLAPHLVRPLGFTWPVYRGARVAKWKLQAGLFLYDALSLFRNVKGFKRLSPRDVLAAEPGLAPEGLTGGARYYDAATDDARLTFVNALAALEAGAVVVNHASVVGLLGEGGRVAGAEVEDMLTGARLRVRARQVVNATGPWTDEIRRLDLAPGEAAGPAVRGSKGVHVAVPRARLGNREALTLLSPLDGRVMFVLPAGDFTIIGTTETQTRAHPHEVRASEADVAYLLHSANGFFPGAHLTRADVVSAWAGIRPLAVQAYGAKAGDANSASREHAIHRSPRGVLSISGGKLTTYRVMARDVVDAALEASGLKQRPGRANANVDIHAAPLPGGDLAGTFDAERAACLDALRALAPPAAASVERPEASAEHLVRAYGNRWRQVLARVAAEPRLAGPLVPGLPYLWAEAAHGAHAELCHTLADLLVRRLKVAFETRDNGLAAAERAADVMAPVLGWDAAERHRQLQRYAEDSRRLFGIDAEDV